MLMANLYHMHRFVKSHGEVRERDVTSVTAALTREGLTSRFRRLPVTEPQIRASDSEPLCCHKKREEAKEDKDESADGFAPPVPSIPISYIH